MEWTPQPVGRCGGDSLEAPVGPIVLIYVRLALAVYRGATTQEVGNVQPVTVTLVTPSGHRGGRAQNARHRTLLVQ